MQKQDWHRQQVRASGCICALLCLGLTAVAAPLAAAETIDREIHLVTGDIWFNRPQLDIKAGETIRFVVKNVGHQNHELVIGPRDLIAAFRNGTADGRDLPQLPTQPLDGPPTPQQLPGLLIPPGQARELLVHFPDGLADNLEFSCNIPGHYEMGMHGAIHTRLEPTAGR